MNKQKAQPKGTLRTCKNGHQYYKTSECPTCPACEEENRPTDGFLAAFYAPARRALENNGIKSVDDLSKFTEGEILQLHGMGKATLPKLRDALRKAGLNFRK